METLGILIYRIEAGQITAQWEVANLAGVMRQLGIVPPSTQSELVIDN